MKNVATKKTIMPFSQHKLSSIVMLMKLNMMFQKQV